MLASSLVLRVGVVSDQPLVTEAVRFALSVQGLGSRTASWGTRRPDALPQDDSDVLLVLCDLADPRLWMSPRLDGVVTADQPVVVLTPAARGAVWGAVLALGADAVMPDTAHQEDVLEALAAAASGRPAMPVADRAALLTRWEAEGVGAERLARLRSLSPREGLVLELLRAGHDVSSVAQETGLGRGTVRTYLAAIRRKLGVNSQQAAVASIAWLPGPHVPASRRPAQ